jgi:hypothetical protein
MPEIPAKPIGVFGAPADHAINIRLRHGPIGKLTCAAAGCTKEKALGV